MWTPGPLRTDSHTPCRCPGLRLMELLPAATLLALLGGICCSVPLGDFYPFGLENGDSVNGKVDDGGSGLLEISHSFPFFGERHSGLYVNNNGIISFLKEVSQFTPVAFPISNDRRVVAAFWADVDNRRAGDVFYRETKDPMILQSATNDIRRYFPELEEFTTQWAFVATWYKVTFFGGSTFSPVNTFQIVLVTDGEFSFTIFNYENITWTTGMHASSGGDFAGLGGIAAQAGFNAGDGKRYFNIPGSRTDDIVDVEMTTNVGIPGRWVFRIHDAQVEIGGCNDTASVCLNLRPCLNNGRCIDDCITGNPSYTCSCRAGFTGRRCQIDIDECASYPCHNGGTCLDGQNAYTCQCTAGYTGVICEKDIDDCASNICQNGGMCIDGIDAYSCKCLIGFTGKHCEIADSLCKSKECQNGGVCDINNGTAVCICQKGYTGESCENETNECNSNPCLNGGECIDLIDNYTCLCLQPFTGKHCETDESTTLNACQPNPCLNGGSCNETEGGYLCNCPEGFTGRDCENEVLQLCNAHHQCPHGASCAEYGGTYRCICPQGSSGKDLIPSPCDSDPCQKGGTCKELDGSYTCQCPPGVSGLHCEKERLRSCASSPCRNGGTCKEAPGGTYQCTCLYRFTGKNCETGKPDPCSSSPCQNSGTCFHYIGKYKCECPRGFTGRHCDTEVDCGIPSEVKHTELLISSTKYGSVAQYICEAGFIVQPSTGESTCQLDGRWSEAPICDEIDECSSEPCWNGGSCKDGINSFVCECQKAFTGTFCESAVNPCRLSPCGARGFCRSVNGSYVCTCKVGYSGKHCNAELAPPAELRVEKSEENAIEISWQAPGADSTQDLIDGFAVTYTSYNGEMRKTDFVDKSRSRHLLRSLSPGRLYNISIFSVKRNVNQNDISKPAVLHVWTKPGPIGNLSLANVTATSISIAWSLYSPKQAATSTVRLSLRSSDLVRDITVPLSSNLTRYTFGDLSPQELYTVEVVPQMGLKGQDDPWRGIATQSLIVWTRPLPPHNLVLAGVTTTTAKLHWNNPPSGSSNGFILNITTNHNLKSRHLPNGKLTTYNVRNLEMGRRYNLALMRVLNTERGKLVSDPAHLTFSTVGTHSGTSQREGHGKGKAKSEPVNVGVHNNLLHITTQPDEEAEINNRSYEDNSQVIRYSEMVDGRGRISATFGNLPPKPITHRASPEPPIQLENLEESTNRISLALEMQESEANAKSETNSKPDDHQECSSNPCKNGGTCVKGMNSYLCDCEAGFKGKYCELFCKKLPHPCTRLYSETKSIPVWEDSVFQFKYRRIYKVHQDTCYKEVCEPVIHRTPRNRRLFRR
ncbi:sushi, nidogen and EGF-like domain-containing protein 1 [Leucoraja erinacea]|uniref:sushi, nidogen and EGF-like domain-containing protein 1 n=1 Tax=Leucoraja erinaceus TaxID=7782 RepID=UPI002457DD2C|nr:sushi, nidogen and EGF-like domain-containing protein 1 [Leucoraja erinacea]